MRARQQIRREIGRRLGKIISKKKKGKSFFVDIRIDFIPLASPALQYGSEHTTIPINS